jgi:hypothetical protein
VLAIVVVTAAEREGIVPMMAFVLSHFIYVSALRLGFSRHSVPGAAASRISPGSVDQTGSHARLISLALKGLKGV